MQITPRADTFNPMAHRFFIPALNRTEEEKAENKRYRRNRETICAYLYRIQKRFDMGYPKQAKALFNHMLVVTNVPRWVAVAAADEIKVPR